MASLDNIDHVKLIFRNFAYVEVDCPRHLAEEFSDYFSYYAKNYKWDVRYQNDVWDGKIKLFNKKTHLLPSGLTSELISYCKQTDIPVIAEKQLQRFSGASVDVDALLKEIDPPFTPYDHQVESIQIALNKKRAFILSPTSSGKSFTIYGIVYHLTKIGKKTLIVVPTIGLVKQLYSDFEDYGFNSDKHVHQIFTGQEKQTNKEVTVSTWQSIYELPQEWFEQYDAIIVDEAHGATGESIQGVMGKAVNAEYRIGLTGTIEELQANIMLYHGMFGKLHRVATTKELMDKGIVSDLKIKAILLTYSEEERQRFRKASPKYATEIKYLTEHKKRNKFLCKIALYQKKNTLLLFNFTKHGELLYEMMKRYAPNRDIYLVHGATDIDDRERVRRICEQSENAIIIASYGVFSTGVNIKNLHYVIFAHPYKAKIKNLQSIGRILRKHESKEYATLIDIADDLSWGITKNTTFKHFEQRLMLYIQEKFNYTITRVSI